MELRQLRHFLLIAETGSLTRAAAHLGVAQPALSRDLRLLETELDTRLFTRDGRGVSLTRDGAAFRAAVAPHVAGLEAARTAFHGRQSRTAGAIRLGWTGTLSIPLGTRIIAAFTRRFPDVELHARGGSSSQVTEWLAREEIDLGVMNSERAASGTLVETLLRAPLHHVMRREPGPPPPATIPFAEAVAMPLFVHSRQNALGRIVESCAREHDIPLKIYAEVDDFTAVRPMIAEGTGAAIVPLSLMYRGLHDDLLVRRVVEPDLTIFFHLAVAKSRRGHPVVQELAETIRMQVRCALAEGVIEGTMPAGALAD